MTRMGTARGAKGASDRPARTRLIGRVRKDPKPVRSGRTGTPVWALAVAVATAGILSSAAVHAADDDTKSPIVGALPESQGHTYAYNLFTLKKNGVVLKMSGAEFCEAMNYGKVVEHHGITFASQPKAVEDGKIVDGPLEWVICRMTK